MSENSKFAFTKTNYLIMIGGILLLFVGFTIMTMDKEPYGFGFLGLTLGPIIVMLGFLSQFVAILYKSKKKDSSES